jgi:ribose transport system substrate-binding protein
MRAGIPIITVDTACLDPAVETVTHIATDNYGGGKQAAYAMIEALGVGGGKIAIVDYKKLESSDLRVKGFKEVVKSDTVLADMGKIELLAELSGGAAHQGGYLATREILRRYPDVDGIFAINDPSALGVIAALQEAGRSDVKVVGFDGSAQGQNAIREGRLYASPMQYPDQVGIEAVRALHRYWRGESLPTEMLIPTSLYRKSDAMRGLESKGGVF